MKILFICDGLGGGGKERRFVQLVKGLNERNYGELYLLMTRDVLAYKELEGYDIKITYIQRCQIGFIKKFYYYIYNLKPDIVQTWELFPMLYYNIISFLLPFNSSYSISTAADCNFDLLPVFKRVLHKWSYLLANNIVGNSKAGLENYQVPHQKRICIYNGFDNERLKRDISKDIRHELNVKTKYVVSMLARFSMHKDWPMFVNSALKLLDRRDDVVFLAIGEGKTRQVIEAMVPEKHKDKILFLGRRNDVEAILRATDVSVLCSNPEKHGEGVSNSILESCAFGVPVIATRGGGTAEIIQDGTNGYLITPHDEKELVDRIEYLLENKDVRETMGEKAKIIVEDKFSLEKSTEKYIQLFEHMNIKKL